jgi:hypothetical protein
MTLVIRGNRYFIDGREVSKSEADASFPDQPLGPCNTATGVKPKLSDALAVHPDQVQEATEHAKRHGVPTEFTQDGRPIIRSRRHQKELIKVYGYRNKDGGYGD